MKRELTPARAKYFQDLRTLRSYIIANPGKTHMELFEATGIRGCMELMRKGLAIWKRDEQGVPRWYVKSNLAYPNIDKHEY